MRRQVMQLAHHAAEHGLPTLVWPPRHSAWLVRGQGALMYS